MPVRPGEGIGGSSTSIGDFARLRPVLPHEPCAKYPREGDFRRPAAGFQPPAAGEGIGGSSTSIGDFARLRPELPHDTCAKYPREGDFRRPAAGLGEMTAVRSGRVTAGKVLPDTCIRRGPLRRSAGIAPPAGHRCGLRAPPARSIRGAAARDGSHRIRRSRAPPGRCRP